MISSLALLVVIGDITAVALKVTEKDLLMRRLHIYERYYLRARPYRYL